MDRVEFENDNLRRALAEQTAEVERLNAWQYPMMQRLRDAEVKIMQFREKAGAYAKWACEMEARANRMMHGLDAKPTPPPEVLMHESPMFVTRVSRDPFGDKLIRTSLEMSVSTVVSERALSGMIHPPKVTEFMEVNERRLRAEFNKHAVALLCAEVDTAMEIRRDWRNDEHSPEGRLVKALFTLIGMFKTGEVPEDIFDRVYDYHKKLEEQSSATPRENPAEVPAKGGV